MTRTVAGRKRDSCRSRLMPNSEVVQVADEIERLSERIAKWKEN